MGTKMQIIDDITTARAWAELVLKGGCTTKVLEQAPQMIGRLHNAERLLERLMAQERHIQRVAYANIAEDEAKQWDRDSNAEGACRSIANKIRAQS